jgi:hypothetical protein
MASLTTCLQKAGALLDPEDRAELLRLASELRASGQDAATAARGAITARMAEVDRLMAGGATDAPRATDAGQPREAMTPEQQERQIVEALATERPDMMVTLPGSNESVRLADAMEQIRAQQLLDENDADLVRAAVLCDLSP